MKNNEAVLILRQLTLVEHVLLMHFSWMPKDVICSEFRQAKRRRVLIVDVFAIKYSFNLHSPSSATENVNSLRRTKLEKIISEKSVAVNY